MPIDASIPLQVQQPNFMTPMQAQSNALTLKDQMIGSQMKQMQLQQAQQTMKNQVLLSQLGSVPGNVDPETGGLTTQAISQITDPNLKQSLMQDRLKTLATKSEISLKSSQAGQEADKRKSTAIQSVMEQAYSDYDRVMKSTGNKEAATDAFNKTRNDKLNELQETGEGGFDWGSEQTKSMAANLEKLSPEQAFSHITTHKERMEAEEKGTDPFMKEAAAVYGVGTPKYNQVIAAHLAKMDTPAKTNIEAGGAMPNTIPAKDQGLTGDEFLKTLPPAQQSEVKALAEGRLPISPYALRSKQMWPLIERTMQYDPSFDASNYQTRLTVRRDFTAGKSSQNITAINTAIGHLGTMHDLTDALNNNDVRAANQLMNTVSAETGHPNVTNFELAKNAVSDELMRVFRQVGASDAEAARWGQTFAAANSPEQLKEAQGVAVSLLNSRLQALNDTWKRGMMTDKDFPNIVSPKSKATLKKMGLAGEIDQGTETKPESVSHETKALPRTNAEGWVLHTDAKGNKAYVSPDGKKYEEAK